jgi:FkbM family methyltransferase
MDLESKQLINENKKSRKIIEPLKNNNNIKKPPNIFSSIIGYINIFIVPIVILIIIIKKMNFSYFKFKKEKIKIPKDLSYYQNKQNNFCENIGKLYDKEIENNLMLFNISLNGTNFDMFIFKNNDYMSEQIQLKKSYEKVGTLNMLNALQYYADKHDYENDDIMIIDMGANIGWYTIFFGLFKYSVLAFEPYPENYYVLKKNYCRNNRDFFGPESTITIVNYALYSKETRCGYYQDIKSSRKDMVICDFSLEDNFGIDYMRMALINSTRLKDFIPLINHKRITLLRIDMEFEGEKAIRSGKDLITLYHVPYVFIEFNKKMFSIHETKEEDFLKFFVNNGYQISLKGFLANDFISIEDLMKKKFKRINLYLVYIEP